MSVCNVVTRDMHVVPIEIHLIDKTLSDAKY